MIFRAALLHSHLLSKTNENIRKAVSVGQPGYLVVSPITVSGWVLFREPDGLRRGNLNWTRGITRAKMLGAQ